MGKGNAEGCASCAKWCLIVFNILFCLIGLGLVATGIFAYIKLSDYLDIIGNSNINAPAIVIIVFGVLTFIVAALGCVGACKESPCLLFMFASIIAILLIAEIGAGIAAFVFRDKIEELFDENSVKLIQTYNESADNVATDVWDKLQKTAQCCGINNADDWKNTTMAPMQGGNVPKSCGTVTKGCKQQVIDLVIQNVYVVGAVAVAFGVIEFLGIVLACCVGCQARKGESA